MKKKNNVRSFEQPKYKDYEEMITRIRSIVLQIDDDITNKWSYPCIGSPYEVEGAVEDRMNQIEELKKNISFKEYQYRASETAIYPNIGKNYLYPLLGLLGEVGELANKIKKIQRDKGGLIDDTITKAIINELGDILWYLSQFATELNISFSDIAETNLEKLRSRKNRNKLHGDGDNR